MAGRLIVIGDIHGCWRELERLIEIVRVSAEDRVAAVGDLVAKGPSTLRALRLARSLPNFSCVRGNHESWLLDAAGRPETERQPSAVKILDEMGAEAADLLAWIASWPLYLEFPECAVIHAGLRPGLPLARQAERDLLSLRALEDGRPWYETYEGERLIVHGHWAAQGLVARPNVIGLDTGCVYGGRLSAVVLPGREIVSVPAEGVYVPISK